MKKVKLFVAMLLVLVCVFSISLNALAAFSTMYVNVPVGETVNFRKTASSGGTILARIPRATAVEAEYYNATWHKVKYNGQTGYIMSQFLSATNPNGSGSSDWASRYGSGTMQSESNPGATQPQVANLQNDLNVTCPVLGITSAALTIDGLYGTRTQSKVREYQGKVPGLDVDGYAGPQTKADLFTRSAPYR